MRALRWERSAWSSTMSTETKSTSSHSHTPWNNGRLVVQKRRLRPKGVRAIVVRLQIENRKRYDRDLTDLPLFRGLGEPGVTGISFGSLRIKGRGVPVAEGGFQRDAAW